MNKFTITLILLTFSIWLVPIEKLQAQDPFECELDFTLKPIGLCGDELGMVEVSITGGFGKYDICWVSNNNSLKGNEVIIGSELRVLSLPAGPYSFSVIDEFSKCRKVVHTIVEYDILRGNFVVNANDARCNGLGSISFDISGNSAIPPYALTIDGPISSTGLATSNDFKIFKLPAGDYEITLEKDGCSRTFNQTVGVKEGLPDFSLESTKDDCGIDIGSVNVTVKDGKGPFLLSWDGPTTGHLEPHDDAIVLGLETGAYEFILEDSEGCRSLQYIDINATSLALSAAKVSNALNGGRGFVKLDVQGGVSNFGVAWDGPESGERTDIDREEVISLPAGTFEVVVTDAAGCSDFITITIEEEIDAVGLANNSGGHRIIGNSNNLLTDNQPLVQQNYPNPFSNQTTIQFDLPKSMEVELLVHDHFGRLVITKRAQLGEGLQQFEINGSDLASGMFFYTIIADEFKVTKRMVVR